MNELQRCIIAVVLVSSFFAADLFAQIELKSVFAGNPPRGITIPGGGTKLDFNADGVPDLPFFYTDSNGRTFIVINDGGIPSLPSSGNSSLSSSWPTVIPFDHNLRFKQPVVVGFFELDGSISPKEIVVAIRRQGGGRTVEFQDFVILANNATILLDGSGKSLVTIADMDKDDCDDIVLYNPDMQQTEVWGEKK